MYSEIQTRLKTLRIQYPFLETRMLTQTRFGRTISAVRLGEGERRVLLTAAHHANEWITALVLLRFLQTYVEGYRAGETVYREMHRQSTLWFVPLVNPDGTDLVTGAAEQTLWSAAEQIARDYPEIPFPQGWKANGSGVDLNLNYPAGFEQARQIKGELGFTSPAPCNWPGQRPLDQPESAALAALTREISPHLMLALHTQGREIYWSYGGYQDEFARNLGEQMARVSGYTLTEPAPVSSYAGFKDWFIAEFQRPGYTIEAGLGQNPLPITDLPQICEELFGVFQLAALYSPDHVKSTDILTDCDK